MGRCEVLQGDSDDFAVPQCLEGANCHACGVASQADFPGVGKVAFVEVVPQVTNAKLLLYLNTTP